MELKKMLATGAALAIAAATSVTSADAGHRYHNGYNNGFPFAAGAFGFAAGALIASALAPRYPYYNNGYYNGYDPYYYNEDPYYAPRARYAPRVHYAPAPSVYYEGPAYNDVCNTPTSKPAWAMC
jgi:hypothetical protein